MDLSVALQVAAGALTAFVLEKLKNSPAIGWITPYTDTINRALSLLIALALSIGITFTWTPDPDTGRGQLIIMGVPFTAALWIEVVVRAFIQYWSSKLTYLGVIKGKRISEVQGDASRKLPALLLVAILPTALLIGCASGGTRSKVTTTYQTVEVALGAVQDAEMQLFAAGVITKEQHAAASSVFVKAFDAQIKFGHALLAWRPEGETALPPQGYAEWIATVESALSVLDAIPGPQPELVSRVRLWVARVVEIIRALNQPVPARLASALAVP